MVKLESEWAAFFFLFSTRWFCWNDYTSTRCFPERLYLFSIKKDRWSFLSLSDALKAT